MAPNKAAPSPTAPSPDKQHAVDDAELAPPPYPSSNGPTISKRETELLKNKAQILGFIEALMKNQWSPENPEGIVILAVAENSLMRDDLLKFFGKIGSGKLDPDDFTYGDTSGGLQTRLSNAISNFVNERFHPLIPVNHEHLAGANGVTALVQNLGKTLCDVGEHFLIAAPYYNGFDNDLADEPQVVPVPISFPEDVDPASAKTLDYFEEEIERIRAKVEKGDGKDVRAVILCNPQNPLGFCYPKETILAYMRLCEKYDLHLISDEIYAYSVYENENVPNPTPFVSTLSIDPQKEAGCDPRRLHVLYGMSKDFCSNGFRIGVVISQHNKDVQTAAKLSGTMFNKISSPADALFTSLLTSDYLPEFLSTSRARLTSAYASVSSALKARGIPHQESYAGHFIVIDLREAIKKKFGLKEGEDVTWELEGKLTQLLIKGGVAMMGGQAYHVAQPGFFRLTFTAPKEYIDIGFKRLDKVLGLTVNE